MHQTATHEDQVACRHEQGQFPHAVTQKHIGGGTAGLPRAAQHQLKTFATTQAGHTGETFRVTGHQDQQGIGVEGTHLAEGRQHLLIFALMGTGRDPYRPLHAEIPA